MSDPFNNHQHLDDFGPVFVLGGKNKGRVGCYDDDEDERAIVYFGSMFLCQYYHLIPYRQLRQANTRDLLERREAIFHRIGSGSDLKISNKERCDLLLERSYIDGELYGNYYKLRYGESSKIKGKRIFISHSSKDKPFVNTLATDLSNFGVKPWVDEWKIRVGQSIPARISEGVKEADFVILILSKNSTKSKWVEAEWQAKYWHEIQKERIALLPVLLEECEIPELLKTKKYADFTESYQEGLTEVLDAIAE